MKIHYRKGSENTRADGLSRREDYMKGEPKKGIQLLLKNADGTLQVNKIAATSVIEMNQLSKAIRKAQGKDRFCQEQLSHMYDSTPDEFDEKDGILQFQGRDFIPASLRETVLRLYHDGPLQGHPGTAKMLQVLQDRCYFPKIRHAIEDYVKKCTICRRNKHDRHAPYCLLQPLQVPNRPWESVAMDFIVKLPSSIDPVTKESYDGIMVVVDRFSKFGRFIPYRETWTATDLAHVFIKNVVANHGLPVQLVTDRDKLFTSNFWTALMQHLGVQHKMSTAYHPQTDGQTERLNQILEQYLRCYVNDRQDNWITLLPLAQIAYNQSPTTTTGTSPFFATYGFEPEDYTGQMEVKADNPTAALTAREFSEMQENLRLDLMFCRTRMT